MSSNWRRPGRLVFHAHAGPKQPFYADIPGSILRRKCDRAVEIRVLCRRASGQRSRVSSQVVSRRESTGACPGRRSVRVARRARNGHGVWLTSLAGSPYVGAPPRPGPDATSGQALAPDPNHKPGRYPVQRRGQAAYQTRSPIRYTTPPGRRLLPGGVRAQRRMLYAGPAARQTSSEAACGRARAGRPAGTRLMASGASAARRIPAGPAFPPACVVILSWNMPGPHGLRLRAKRFLLSTIGSCVPINDRLISYQR
jgi:hypothetical protein